VGQTLHNLQALRGVACLLVVAFHLGGWEQQYGVKTPAVQWAQWFGFAGVDVFFALSGFIITYTQARQLGRPAAAPGYLFRRLWRVFPPFWAAMVLAGLAYGVLLNVPVLDGDWVRDWAHWLALLPGDPPHRWIAPAWTLTYEVMFYLAFTVLLLLPPRVGAGLLAGWAAAVLANVPAWQPGGDPYAALVLSPYVLEFLGGCAVAGLVLRGARRGARPAVLAAVAYAVVGVLLARGLTAGDWLAVINREPVRVAVFGPPAVLLVYGMAAGELGGRLRAPRWLRPVGDASYSIYLIHCPVGAVAVIYGCYVGHSRWPHLGWLAATFLLCVAAGFALHYAVERPLLALVRRRKKPRPAAPAAEPTPARRAA
jgi:peptidoglycan/LPS O-acetylase OafA/YrhL